MRQLGIALSAAIVLAAGVTVAIAGTPFGGDDTGTVPDPAHKTTLKCEETIGKAVGKAVGCIGKCTAKRSSGSFTDDTAEDACEKNNAGKSCLEKFQASVAKLTGCPPCLNAAALSTTIETTLDGANSLTYCASPSGAFLE